MLKRILSVSLCVCMCLPFVGCKKKADTLSVDSGSVPPVSSEVKPVTYINPLTGLDGLDKETALQRPVAIMVNNISVAQPVQTGLTKADIIYETEVEGGITRLLAVFKDFKNVSKVGTVRSARYDYIDLAMGHNAIYAHHGQDNYHAPAHLKDIDRIIVGTNNGGQRQSNGLALEHTLYANGDKIWNSIKKQGINTTLKSMAEPWMSFSDGETPVTFTDKCLSVTVPFSYSYKTTFKYNNETGRYTRYFNNVERKDYNTKESVTVKNVFVLNTTITSYPGCKDGKGHRKVRLTSGDGYYCVNGTYIRIKWSKGASSNSFKFTKYDGSQLTVNPGNSWVCIADGARSKTTFVTE